MWFFPSQVTLYVKFYNLHVDWPAFFLGAQVFTCRILKASKNFVKNTHCSHLGTEACLFGGVSWLLRNVGAILLSFHVLQLILMSFTQQNSYCLNKSITEYLQIQDWKANLTRFGYGYQNCMFVDFLTGYIGPPNYVH